MKKITFIAAVAAAAMFTSCGMLTLPTSTTDTTSATTTSTTSATESSSSTSVLGSILVNVLGALTQSTNETTILGTWTYQQPDVKFSSDNLLAKAGGTVASAEAIKKLEPYYEKVGIKQGNVTLTLKDDNTCTYTLGSKTYSGTYTYDKSANTVVIKGTLLSFPTAYVAVSGSQLSLTFDSTKILTLIQSAGALSGKSSDLSTISSIAKAYDGMKTGFLFTK